MARRSLLSRLRRFLATTGVIFVIVLVGRLWSGGYLDRDPIRHYPAVGVHAPLQVLYFSGDAGMRFGMGPHLAPILAAHGIETTAVATSTAFRFGKSRAELDAYVAAAIADVERHANGRRLIVMAQSYGADIAQTGLAALPAGLRKDIAGVVLIVPGTGTYFRADPLELLYHRSPDSRSLDTLERIDWAPLVCIFGREEDDSVCPALAMRNATVIALPGGHYLNHDKVRLAATVMRAVEAIEHRR